MVPGGTLWGTYMNDGDYDTDYVHSNLLTLNPETIWGVAFQMDLTDEVQFWVNYWDVDGTNAGGTDTGDAQQFAVGLNWFPAAAPGFSIKTTYYNGELDAASTPLAVVTGTANDTNVNADYDGFEITVRRDF